MCPRFTNSLQLIPEYDVTITDPPGLELEAVDLDIFRCQILRMMDLLWMASEIQGVSSHPS